MMAPMRIITQINAADGFIMQYVIKMQLNKPKMFNFTVNGALIN
jgi:hypothetical protein